MNQRNPKLAVLALVIVLAGILSGCGAAQPSAGVLGTAAGRIGAQAARDLPETIDVAAANQLASQADVFLLDVREESEYASGHIPGATLIPLGQLQSRLSEIPKDKTVVAVCRSGNRSGQATTLLRQQGFDAYNMAGGMNAWQQAGLPVER